MLTIPKAFTKKAYEETISSWQLVSHWPHIASLQNAQELASIRFQENIMPREPRCGAEPRKCLVTSSNSKPCRPHSSFHVLFFSFHSLPDRRKNEMCNIPTKAHFLYHFHLAFHSLVLNSTSQCGLHLLSHALPIMQP